MSMRAFVGRDAERHSIEDAAAKARSGHGRFLVIGGEPGVGKTRLIREVCDGLEGNVVWSYCWSLSPLPAFWAFRELFAGLAHRLPSDHPRFDGEAQNANPAVAPEERFGMFMRVFELLEATARDAPLVWVIDDVHAADLASLELLEFVATRVHSTRVLVVASCRSVARGTDADAERRLAAILRRSERLDLEGLGVDDVCRFVRQRTGAQPSRVTVDRLMAATRGNPLFLDGAARTPPAASPPHWTVGHSMAPAGVAVAIEHRLELAGPLVRRALEAASVLGAVFELETVAEIAGMDAEDAAEALSHAEREGLVEAANNANSLRFFHQLTQEAVYGMLPRSRRLALHRAAAVALGRHAGEPCEELLRHALAIGNPDGDALKIASHLARRARALLAYEVAARHYRTALTLASGPERGDILLGLGDAEVLSGATATARAHFSEACRLGRQLGDESLFAEAALALTRTVGFGALDLEVIDALQEALHTLPDGVLQTRVKLRLAEELWFDEANLTRRGTLSEDALTHARAVGDPDLLAHALGARIRATWGTANAGNRAVLSKELAHVASRTRSVSLKLQACRWRMNSLWERGKSAEADATLEQFVRLAEQLASPQARANALWRRIVSEEIKGNIDAVGPLHEALDATAAEADHPLRRIFAVMPRFMVDVERGDDAAITRLLPEYLYVAERLRHIPAGHALPAYVHYRVGDLDRARMHLLDTLERGVPTAYADATAYCMLAQVAIAVSADEQILAELYGRLLPVRRLFGVAGLGACFGSFERYLGQLARHRGDLHSAREHFEAAVRNNHRAGVRGYHAHALRELARVSRELDGDSDRVRSLDAEALELARSLGFTRLETLLSHAPAATPTARVTVATLARRGDGWVLRCGAHDSHLKNRKGLQYLARILAQPGVSFPALDLAREEIPRVMPATQSGLEILDRRARDDYRARITHLREVEDAATEAGQAARAKTARAEREFLEEHLLGAMGLGGARRVGGDGERARVSVTNAIRRAVAAISRHAPALGTNLRATVRTGRVCSYDPTLTPALRWAVSNPSA